MNKIYSLLFLLLFLANSNAQERSLTFNDVSVIEIAPNGNTWVGSSANGCMAYIASSQAWSTFNALNSSMRSDSVTCIALYAINTIPHSFMGSTNGIGYRHGTTWDTIANLPNRFIVDMIKSPDHVFYVATQAGVASYIDTSLIHIADYTTSNSALPSEKITCFQSKPLTCNGFYAGTSDTGYFYTTDAVSFTHKTTANSQLIDNRVNCLYVDNNCAGKVYIGTQGGLSICDNSSCSNFTDATGLPENDISVIEKASDTHTWVGTRNGGIAIYNDTTFTYLTTSNGLPSNKITSINCKTNCECWVGTADAGAVVVSCTGQISQIPTDIAPLANDDLMVTAYPQPAVSTLNIRMNKVLRNSEFILHDVSGKVVYSQQIDNSNKLEINTSALAQGLYYYSLTTANAKQVSGKVQIVK